MVLHRTFPSIFVVDRFWYREVKAFRRSHKHLAVKICIPGIKRSISRSEQLHHLRPYLCEWWCVSEESIGQTVHLNCARWHLDIRLTERVIHQLSILVYEGDFDDLAVPVQVCATCLGINNVEGVCSAKSACNCCSTRLRVSSQR